MAKEMQAELKYFIFRETMEGWSVPPRCLKEYELVYISRGVGMISIGEETFRVTAGDLVFFTPGIKNALWVEEEPYFAFYGMHFTLPEGEAPPPFPHVSHPVSHMRLDLLFRKINEAHIEKGYLYEWREKLLLSEILLEICAFLHEKNEPIANMRVRKALKDIQNHPLSELSASLLMENTDLPVSQIAETCGFSDPLYFSRCFRAHYQSSPRGYRERMQK